MFGGVIDACCRLPRDVDVLSWNGEGCFFPDVHSMNFVMATYEVTTHAPAVFFLEEGILLFIFILLRVYHKQAFRGVEGELRDPSAH